MITLEIFTKNDTLLEYNKTSCIVAVISDNTTPTNSENYMKQVSIFKSESMTDGPETFVPKETIDYDTYLEKFRTFIKEGYNYRCMFNLNEQQIVFNMYATILANCSK